MSQDSLENLSCQPNVHEGSCPTCGDEALPARILQINDDSNTAQVLIEGAKSEVALDLIGEVQVGDTILVHIGFAIAKLESE